MSIAVSDTRVTSSRGAKAYFPGLDGVRALAVTGVLLYHGDLPWFQGGFLGVDVFFVLSGFLITGLIAHEVERTGALNIRGFYLRRFRRLVPALLFLLLTTAIGAAFFVPDAAPRLRADSLASLLYVSNWWLIVNGQSYFEFISRPPLLQHLWSLGIEEQFYLLWPVCVLGLMRWGGRRLLMCAALLLAVGSTVWMAYLSIEHGYPDADPSRIYFGTDTHCMGLLSGAALAAVWQPWSGPKALTHRVDALLALLGALACVAVAFAYVEVGEHNVSLYRGGFLLLSAVVCSLIVAASYPSSLVGRLLGRQPLRWIGERSYGLYLWHWPIFMTTRPGLDVPITGVPNLVLRLALTVAVTELSFRLVERPIREGVLGRFFNDWRTALPSERRPLAWRATLAAVPATALIVLAVAVMLVTPAAKAGGAVAADVAEAMGIANGGPTKVTVERVAARPPAEAASTIARVTAPAPSPTATSSRAEVTSVAATVNNGGLTAVGDSVLLGIRFRLEKSIRGVETDAEVGRQASDVVQRLRDLHAEHLLAPTVLVHVGTNSLITENQLRRTLTELADRDRVIIVNAHAPRRWVAESNDVVARVLPDYPNAVLLDWAMVSTGHPEFFVSDDIHLSASGQQAFISAVIKAGGFPTTPPPLAQAPGGRRAADVIPAPPEKAPVPESAPEQQSAPSQGIAPAQESEPAPADGTQPQSPSADPSVSLSGREGSVPLIRHTKPMAPDSFWEAIADCETGGKWTNAGRYAGGLGIFVTSWEGWGGREFSPTPAEASPAQQIIVANRISTQGWTRPDGKYVRPVGFGGWGCVKTVGPPVLLIHTAESVLAQHFSWGQRGEIVRELQTILALPRDGVYGRQTWQLHVRRLEALQLPRTLAPENPPAAAASILATR